MALDKWEKQHVANIAKYEKEIQQIYATAIAEASQMASRVNFDPSKPFAFSDYPLTKALITKLQKQVASDIEAVITKGVDTEFGLSQEKAEELAQSVYSDVESALMELRKQTYILQRNKAREAFLTRKEAGLSLSDRVWRYTGQFKEELEMALDLGLRDGLSADELSREVRKYLNNPNMLFRRVRDEHGVLHLSKRAKAYHPGQGVYRSSYKNARRLTATETNMAYRTADYNAYQALSFVVGIRIMLSNNHTLNGEPFHDICDVLSAPNGSTATKGRGCYPKDFKFTGWHPLCRCFVQTIHKTKEELREDRRRKREGLPPLPPEQSANYVGDVPDEFKAWCRLNAGRVERAKSLPYFIRDNQEYYDAAFKKKALTPLELAEQRHAQRTPEQVQAIKNRWYERQKAAMQSPFSNNWEDVKQVYDCDFHISEPNQSIAKDFDCIGFFEELEQMSNNRGIYISDAALSIYSDDMFEIGYFGNSDKFRLQRTFERVNGRLVVRHDLFEVPEPLQGQGYSKEVFRALYKQYQRMGVERIEVFANINVGGYTWGKYGFSVANKQRALRALRNDGTAEYQKAVQVIEDYYASHSLDDSAPFPMNLIASQPYGKKVLLDSHWRGTLDLTDDSARKIFEAYLGL